MKKQTTHASHPPGPVFCFFFFLFKKRSPDLKDEVQKSRWEDRSQKHEITVPSNVPFFGGQEKQNSPIFIWAGGELVGGAEKGDASPGSVHQLL